MKKTAVLIYDQFCNFEIAPALEMLAIAEKPIAIFAKSLVPVRSEEGLIVMPERSIDQLNLEEYDSLLLPGALDIRGAIEDEAILSFIKKFDGMPIGAISIAPLLLLKAGMLEEKPFMAGVNQKELADEGYTSEPIPEGYIRSGNIITSVSYNFVKWALGFGEMLGINLSPKTFGL